MKVYRISDDVFPLPGNCSDRTWKSKDIFVFSEDGELEMVNTWFEIRRFSRGHIVEIGDPTGDRWPVPASGFGYWCYPFAIESCEKMEIAEPLDIEVPDNHVLTVDADGSYQVRPVDVGLTEDYYIYSDYPRLKPEGWNQVRKHG